jgi:hypothetical protein
VVSFTPLPLYPRGMSPWYPLGRRLGGPQSRSGRRGGENILDPTGTRTLTPQSTGTQQPCRNNTSSRACQGYCVRTQRGQGQCSCCRRLEISIILLIADVTEITVVEAVDETW